MSGSAKDVISVLQELPPGVNVRVCIKMGNSACMQHIRGCWLVDFKEITRAKTMIKNNETFIFKTEPPREKSTCLRDF